MASSIHYFVRWEREELSNAEPGLRKDLGISGVGIS